jgi:hypothetical protein
MIIAQLHAFAYEYNLLFLYKISMTIDSIYSLIMSMKQFRSIQSRMAKLLVQIDKKWITKYIPKMH